MAYTAIPTQYVCILYLPIKTHWIMDNCRKYPIEEMKSQYPSL